MRLLERKDNGEFRLTNDLVNNIPTYAILSHTWGDHDQEVTFKDLIENTGKSKDGYRKIQFCGEQAAFDGYRYIWVDTCCIDKSNNAELSEALNSMYRWYRNSAKCYVYLADVSVTVQNTAFKPSQFNDKAFQKSRWFTRGWTLQELIAPHSVEFFSCEGKLLGNKKSLERQIHEITGIAASALQGAPVSEFGVEERFAWAAKRETEREEDRAYSLLGIFGVFLPLIYGEGQENAFRRLRKKVDRSDKYHEDSNKKEELLSSSYYDIPFRRNRRFIGRSTVLEKLTQKLLVDKECQKLAIVGLGGIGKTQVALEFAYMVKVNWPEYSVFWIPALSMESMEQAYARIAKMKNISQTADDKETVKEVIRQHLSNNSAGKWLLVVDNADDIETVIGTGQSKGIIDYLPDSDHGLILFTTRHQELAVSLAGSDVLEVEEMDRPEAASFLDKSLIRKELLNNDAIITQLLDELTYLPLAIAQAVAYLNTNKNTSILDYLRLLRNTEQNITNLLSQEFRDDTRYKDSNNAVAKTWLVSFDQIRKRDSVAADLLSFMSCIEWKAIPRSILPTVDPEERMVRAIGTLCGYSFIVKRGDEDTYDIHRLVHLATGIWVEKYGIGAEIVKKAVRHISKVFPHPKHTNRAVWIQYLPHAIRLLRSNLSETVDDRYALCFKIGLSLYTEGRAHNAVRWLEECYQWRETTLAEENSSRLASQHALAYTYQADGQIKKAVDLLEHLVAVKARTLAEEHPSRITSQQTLAHAYQADGQATKAVELLEYVLIVQTRTLAEDHPHLLSSQHALAHAYQVDAQPTKAAKLLEHVVAVRMRTLAEDDPSRLASQHVLARAYQADKQIKKAVKLLEHVVAVEARTIAEEHPSRLESQHELARAYERDNQVKKSIELLEHVVAVEARTLSEEHPSRLASQQVLANAYCADGQVTRALELLEHVVAVEARTLTEEHPSRLDSQYLLAKVYKADHQVIKAVKLLQHVVAVRERTLRADHPSLLRAQRSLKIYQQLVT